MKRLGFGNVLMIGLGGCLLVIAFNQYIIGTESLNDLGVPVMAKVIEVKVEERSIKHGKYESSLYYYNVGIPVISYEVDGKTYTVEMAHWEGSMDGEIETSHILMAVGDQVELLLNPNDPEVFIGDVEDDPTNWIGFSIWGGLGGMLIFTAVRRMRKK